MHNMSISSKTTILITSLALLTPSNVYAQRDTPAAERDIIVYGMPPAELSGLTEGPEVKGFISARSADKVQVTSADGAKTAITIAESTQIRSSKGFLGIGGSNHDVESLLNGLPVTVKTVEWAGGLVASRVKLRGGDLKTANMIRNGTEQGFAKQTAATEALRGRMGDIDKYNVRGTTNVYFDTGKWKLSDQAGNELCAAAAQAEAMDNALLLVVGYTDSAGSQDYNQILSDRRAGRVVNYLQQACGWKPYRMLIPTGMSEADPLANNDTSEGKAQNRRVAVNVLVSKSVDGL